MMKQLIYSPQPDITIYELALVLKVFTYVTFPAELKTDEMLFIIYDELPNEAKRHFKIIETLNK